jgi:hypothetical protein
MGIWKKCRITMIFPTVIPIVFHKSVDKYEDKDGNFGDESSKLLRLGIKNEHVHFVLLSIFSNFAMILK